MKMGQNPNQDHDLADSPPTSPHAPLSNPNAVACKVIDGLPTAEASKSKTVYGSILCGSCDWLAMLCRELDLTFVLGVVIVYGISQGVGGALQRVIVDYYWKDVQLAQPSAVQFYMGIVYIAWDVKPVWGLLTDTVPIAGYHRRPYFVLSGLVGVVSCTSLVLGGKLHAAVAVSLLAANSASGAFADVTIDAVAAQRSRTYPHLATDVQSLMSISSSLGNLAGFSLSGLAVSAFGPQGGLGLLAIPPILFILLGFLLSEPRVSHLSGQQHEVGKALWKASGSMWTTLMLPLVWRPTLYMFLSWAICPDISEGQFYFYTNKIVGLSFSQEYIGVIFALGSIGAILATLIYHKVLKDFSFRCLLLWAQLFIALFGMLDLILVTRLNLRLGIPDYVFVVIDESLSRAINRLKWIPLLVLAAKLCPSGIEGTFFALLMSVDNIGVLFSTWGGGLLLKLCKVTRTDFTNLWLAVLVRNVMRLFPLFLLYLVPNTPATFDILPAEFDRLPEEDANGMEENIELVSQTYHK